MLQCAHVSRSKLFYTASTGKLFHFQKRAGNENVTTEKLYNFRNVMKNARIAKLSQGSQVVPSIYMHLICAIKTSFDAYYGYLQPPRSAYSRRGASIKRR